MNYQYFGLFLNEHNRNELMKIIFANPIIANLVLQRGSRKKETKRRRK